MANCGAEKHGKMTQVGVDRYEHKCERHRSHLTKCKANCITAVASRLKIKVHFTDTQFT